MTVLTIEDPTAARRQLLGQSRAELLTVKEYAHLTRTHLQSVYRRIREGRQQGATRHGGRWLVDLRLISSPSQQPPRRPD